jgi:hypothetical protein
VSCRSLPLSEPQGPIYVLDGKVLGSVRITTVELSRSLGSGGESCKSVVPGLLRESVYILAFILRSKLLFEGCVYLLFWREVRRVIVAEEERRRQIGSVSTGEDFLAHHQSVQ